MTTHLYLSTACIHGLHEKCNKVCKYGEPPEWCTCECHKGERPESRTIAFVSTGDADRDAEIAKRFQRNDERIARGECPNGDGLLVQGLDSKYPETWECPQCHFGYSGPAKWLAERPTEPSDDELYCSACGQGLTLCEDQKRIGIAIGCCHACDGHSVATNLSRSRADLASERSRNQEMRERIAREIQVGHWKHDDDHADACAAFKRIEAIIKEFSA